MISSSVRCLLILLAYFFLLGCLFISVFLNYFFIYLGDKFLNISVGKYLLVCGTFSQIHSDHLTSQPYLIFSSLLLYFETIFFLVIWPAKARPRLPSVPKVLSLLPVIYLMNFSLVTSSFCPLSPISYTKTCGLE